MPIKYGVPPNAAAAAVVAWKVGGPLFGPDELLAPLLRCGHVASKCSSDPHVHPFHGDYVSCRGLYLMFGTDSPCLGLSSMYVLRLMTSRCCGNEPPE